MLVLTRKLGESLVMTTENGEVIRVTLSYAPGNRVKVAIDAPQSVRVQRAELLRSDVTEGETR
jgi:carbon storage regulator